MTEQPNRPEAVDAVFAALSRMDPGALAPFEDTGLTPGELQAGKGLFAAAVPIAKEQGAKLLEVFEVLHGAGYHASLHPTWTDAFDLLNDAQVDEMRSLYSALPEEARAEFDRRYGRPEL